MKHLIITATCILSSITFFSQTTSPERKSLSITEISIENKTTVKELNTINSHITKKEETLFKEKVLSEPKKVAITTPKKK